VKRNVQCVKENMGQSLTMKCVPYAPVDSKMKKRRGGDGMKRGERKDGSVVEHCGIRIAAKWKYCPMCGKKKETKVVAWR